jgi:hypothetical protein
MVEKKPASLRMLVLLIEGVGKFALSSIKSSSKHQAANLSVALINITPPARSVAHLHFDAEGHSGGWKQCFKVPSDVEKSKN